MKTISILGCGWLGMPLANVLANKGYDVLGSTTSEEKISLIEEIGVSPFLIDIQNLEDANSNFFSTDILIITIPPGKRSEAEFLSAMEAIRTKFKGHIIFISSTSVYPGLNRTVIEKDASLDAKTRKGISLLKIERVFDSPTNSVIRFAGLIGPDRHPGRWFAGKENLEGGNIPINMIHLDDCIGIIKTIIEKELWGETFNACSPEHPVKSEYYAEMSRQLGLEEPAFAAHDESDWKIVSSEKLIQQSGYEFKKSVFDLS